MSSFVVFACDACGGEERVTSKDWEAIQRTNQPSGMGVFIMWEQMGRPEKPPANPFEGWTEWNGQTLCYDCTQSLKALIEGIRLATP